MWVYVKFIEDDVCEIVNSNDIKKFDKNDIKFYQKYSVKWKDGDFYKAQILHARESIEELKELIDNRRVRMLNKQLLESGDDSSEELISSSQLKIGVPSRHKQKDLTKIAIENSKKNLQLDILKKYERAQNEKVEKNSKKNEEQVCEKCLSNKKFTEELKIKNQELLTKIKMLEELNISLQKEVIDRMIDFKIAQPGTSDAAHEPEMPKVGQAIDDEVHIGQGIFLKKGTYNSCLVSARSGAQFVKNIAVALYGIDVLRSSSVTGKASNRIKGNKDVRPSLDPNRLQAIRDIYRHYLLEKGQDEISLDYDLSKIGTYIASKISDLNRVSRASKAGTVKAPSVEEPLSNDEAGANPEQDLPREDETNFFDF